MSQVAIGLLRQQLPPGDQVHGVVTPESRSGQRDTGFDHRSLHGALPELRRIACATAEGRGLLRGRGAGGGCTVAYAKSSPPSTRTWRPTSSCRRHTGPMRSHSDTFPGLTTADTPLPTLSTDMANVSLAVPTIHPLIGIETNGAVNHQKEFAAACVTASADAAVRDGAVALAWTAIDAASKPELRSSSARSRVITEHALLPVIPGARAEILGGHGTGEDLDRGQSWVCRSRSSVASSDRATSYSSSNGEVSKTTPMASQLTRLRGNGAPHSTTSTTPSRSWSTSKPWSSQEPLPLA